MIGRRRLLQMGCGALSFGSFPPVALARTWGYSGEVGPEAWGELSETFQLCSAGQQQSPIDLGKPKLDGAVLDEGAIAYQAIPSAVQDTGLTLQVDTPAGNLLYLDGEAFALRQFHFHAPSEHRLDGAAFPMELHLVHQSEAGTLAVVSVFLQVGRENLALAPVWSTLVGKSDAGQVMVQDLLPGDRRVVSYQGSLTTPPCSEGVRWVVFQTPIEVSRQQLEAFQKHFAPNARPLQPLMNRVLGR
ncbi:MAG: carbonic anhydrase family protein [Cyanobacteria bacterium P01_A01_bin.135]